MRPLIIIGIISISALLNFSAAVTIIDITGEIDISYDEESSFRDHDTNELFLSIALDSTAIGRSFKNFDVRNTKLMKTLKHLAPAYFRIGGTGADRVEFLSGEHPELNSSTYPPEVTKYKLKGSQLKDVVGKLTDLGFEVIFDLNVLMRSDNGSWEPGNVEELIRFAAENDLKLDWELGNEPTLMKEKIGVDVPADVLAEDFETLRNILNKYSVFENSMILGPDVTRPQKKHKASLEYLDSFLDNTKNGVLDVITWHQYYFAGSTAQKSDFLDTTIFDSLKWDIAAIHNLTKEKAWTKQVWLGETADSYNGGAQGLSDKFIAIFIWLDKLGICAKQNVDVVIRQAIVGNPYALLDDLYNPLPSWWASILFQRLVGKRVLYCNTKNIGTVRFYCHKHKEDTSLLTVFGVNVGENSESFNISDILPKNFQRSGSTCEEFILTGHLNDVLSGYVDLNGKLLTLSSDYDLPNITGKVTSGSMMDFPGYSAGFWTIPVA